MIAISPKINEKTAYKLAALYGTKNAGATRAIENYPGFFQEEVLIQLEDKRDVNMSKLKINS